MHVFRLRFCGTSLLQFGAAGCACAVEKVAPCGEVICIVHVHVRCGLFLRIDGLHALLCVVHLGP